MELIINVYKLEYGDLALFAYWRPAVIRQLKWLAIVVNVSTNVIYSRPVSLFLIPPRFKQVIVDRYDRIVEFYDMWDDIVDDIQDLCLFILVCPFTFGAVSACVKISLHFLKITSLP